MGRPFDLEKLRGNLLGIPNRLSLINFYLGEPESAAISAHALVDTVTGMLSVVMQGYLTGLDQAVEPVLARARSWQQTARKLGQLESRNGGPWTFHVGCFWSEWFASNAEQSSSATLAMDLYEAEITREVNAQRHATADTLDAYFRFAVAASQFARAHRFIEVAQPELKSVPDAGPWRTEHALGMAVCRSRVSGADPWSKVNGAVQQWLKSKVPSLFSNGLGFHAIGWLKYEFQIRQQQSLPPPEVVRKALEYMPVAQAASAN